MITSELTIIVPVFNEQESLLKFKEEMDKFLNESPKDSGVLFVNDGSTDDSLSIIRKLHEQDKRYGYISLKRNSGLSTALYAGFQQVNTPLLGYIDADLQTSPMDFITYFPYLEGHDMVNGIRANRHDSVVKMLSSKMANAFRRFMINDGITDTCCPLKIIKTEQVKKLPFFKGMHRFIPALIQLQGGKVHQLEVQHFERYAGTAKYNLTNRLIGPFFDTLAFVWMRKRAIRYELEDEGLASSET